MGNFPQHIIMLHHSHRRKCKLLTQYGRLLLYLPAGADRSNRSVSQLTDSGANLSFLHNSFTIVIISNVCIINYYLVYRKYYYYFVFGFVYFYHTLVGLCIKQ